MIGTLVLVLGIIGLGLGVVAVAMRAGPRGARRPAGAPLYGGRKVAVFAAGLVTLAFGIGVPAAVIAANNDSQSKQATGGVTLTSFEQHGRKVFARNCADLPHARRRERGRPGRAEPRPDPRRRRRWC